VSIWDFSGVESYYVTHDRFLGDPNAVYLVVVSCRDSMSERQKQLDFWLNFVATRMIPVEPIGKFLHQKLISYRYSCCCSSCGGDLFK